MQSTRRMQPPRYLFVCSISLCGCHLRSFCLISEWNFKFPWMVTVGRTALQHGRYVVSAISRARLCRAIATVAIVTVSAGPALAQALSFAPAFRFDLPLSQYAPQQQDEEAVTEQLPAQFRRQMVTYPTKEPAGTIIIDTAHTFLYLTLGHGMTMRYGIGVGRQGFTWSGVETIVRKSDGRAGAVSRQHRISHPRHQRSDLDRQARFKRLHQVTECRHHRSLQSRRHRNESGRVGKCRAPRVARRPQPRCDARPAGRWADVGTNSSAAGGATARACFQQNRSHRPLLIRQSRRTKSPPLLLQMVAYNGRRRTSATPFQGCRK